MKQEKISSKTQEKKEDLNKKTKHTTQDEGVEDMPLVRGHRRVIRNSSGRVTGRTTVRSHRRRRPRKWFTFYR